ncbi:RDD family protein [Streptomyces sp. WMMC500]|uniref:RDD family protein n=1 Tax=Streptomyces sp. WMMC500 TaxID=3015154 RepID=UPI00248B63AE|nr:RDD family protein [Streptomyces sp. WMMC500]WBB59090.1 RDD family protein [Streptomyces sp. WMMC500]
MTSSDHGEGADPHRRRPTRAQQPAEGAPSDGTRRPEEEAEPPPGDEHGAQESHEGHGPPARGSGTTRPVGRPTTSERPGGGPAQGAAPGPGVTPPTGPDATSSEGPAATPPTGPEATPSAGPAAAPPTGPDAASPEGPAATPPTGPDATSPSGPGAPPSPGAGPDYGGAPPPGAGSPYDQPPGAMPPPPPAYGVGDQGGYGSQPGPGSHPGYGGSPYGAPDPRLAGMPPLGGLGRRLLARIIDALIVYIPVSLFLTLIGQIDDFADTDNTGSQYGWGLFGILVYLVYEGLMLTRSGQTVGKKLMGIRVGMLENGAVPAGNPGWIRAAVYSLPGLVPCIGTLFWLYNVLSCTWDRPYRQCVHDKAARTVVVSTEGQRFTP